MNTWIIALFLLEVIFFAFSIFNIFALKTRGFLFLFLPLIITSILGGILFSLTLRLHAAGFAEAFLLLAGAAPCLMFISIILHNFVSAGITKLRGGKEFEEPVFFLIALFGCPAAFLVGVIGTIVVLIKAFIAK